MTSSDNPGRLEFRTGDATQPPADPHPQIIAHVCNDLGRWGKGFVVALSRRWPKTEQAYRDWSAEKLPEEEYFALGALQIPSRL